MQRLVSTRHNTAFIDLEPAEDRGPETHSYQSRQGNLRGPILGDIAIHGARSRGETCQPRMAPRPRRAYAFACVSMFRTFLSGGLRTAAGRCVVEPAVGSTDPPSDVSSVR